MQFVLDKNIDRTWDLVPTSGPFAGQVVGNAEGVNLVDAKFFDTKIVGGLRAVWGLTIHIEDVYTDPDMLRGLCIGKSFNADAQCAAALDRDGFKDPFTLRLLKGARRVMLLGQAIYTKGSF